MIFLGKVEAQDSFVCFDGDNIVLTKSVRRVATSWKSHLSFYVSFKNASWEFKTGLGGRVVPTKRAKEPIGSSFSLPQGTIQGSAFYDEEGEAVREKAREEAREDAELAGMMAWDKQAVAVEAPTVTFGGAIEVEAEVSEEEPEITVCGGPTVPVVASETAPVVLPPDPPSAVGSAQPTTPRMSSTTRSHDDVPDDHEAKKARTAEQKRQRIERLSAEYSSMIRSVKVANDEFYTMDD